MIVLTNPDVLRVSTSAATGVDVVVSYVDTNATTTTSGRQLTNIAAAATTTVLAAPAAGTERVIKQVHIQAEGGAQNMGVRITTGVTNFLLFGNASTLLALARGDTLQYTDTEGWRVMNAAGKIVFDVPTGGGGSTPSGTGFRHVTAGVEDAASKLVDTADVNLLQITTGLLAANAATYAKFQQGAANTMIANATAGVANFADLAISAESIPARTSGNISQLTSAVQTALIRAAGSLFFAAAAAGQSLRRSIAGGDLGFSAAEERALGVPIVANAAAVGLTTVLSCTGSQNIPANSTIVGSTFILRGWFSFLHLAATTPTITAQLAVNGATVASAILTPIATAGTFSGAIDGVLTIRTTGAGGTAMPQVHFDQNFGGVGTIDGSVLTAAVGFDTTIIRSLELRIFMTTAIAGNTLTVTNGYIQRIS